MLSIEPSKNADSALRYFRESLSVGDYYSQDKMITGQWHGKVAEQLGLYGDVVGDDFEKLLGNINPQTGKRLTARNSKNRRPMYDFTFNAPKSVSLVHAITGDGDILKAHQRAVLAVMAEVEANMQTQAGSGKGKHYRATGNALFAEFIHTTTRPVKQTNADKKKYAPDPHLHSHCAVINATFCAQQNRFKAIEIGNIKAQGEYYEALYHSYMAQYLEKSGYDIARTGKRWEIAGIDRELVEKFSSRTMEIEALAKKRNCDRAKDKARLGRLTRKNKNQSVADEFLQEIWTNYLSEDEARAIFSAKKKDAHGGDSDRTIPAPSPKPIPDITAKDCIDLALEHYLERNSAIAEKKVLAFAINLAGTNVAPKMIKEELSSRTNILAATKNDVRYITTIEMDAEEENLITRAVSGKAQCPPLNPDYVIKNDILNAGQRAAITHVLTSNDEIMIVSGDAGVGKTTLLEEVKQGVEQQGKKIFAFAPSSDAARNVLRSKGFEEAETIAMLLKNEVIQDQLEGQVIVIDEAGLIGVPTMNKILDIAEAKHARVILSGDWKQHSSVERGDALKILETKPKLKIARVSEIVRQQAKSRYKRIIERIAAGIGVKHNPDARKNEILGAFTDLDKAGSIIEIEGRESRHEHLAQDYMTATQAKQDDALVVAPTHKEGNAITAIIRDHLKKAQRIEGYERAFTRLKSKYYTGAQKQFPGNYSVGDVVEFHQNVTGFTAGQPYVITGHDGTGSALVKAKGDDTAKPLPRKHHASFDIYEEEDVMFATGDLLRITKNCKSLSGSNLYNGQTYTVRGFDDQGNIMLSNGETLSKEARHVNLGYVTTSHASQGKDAKTVLITQSRASFKASNDKQFYVSISRGVEQCFIYTDDKDGLKEAISENGDGMSAQEIAEAARKVKEKDDKDFDLVMAMHRLREFYNDTIKPIFQQAARSSNEEQDDNGYENTMEWTDAEEDSEFQYPSSFPDPYPEIS
ncbi:MAG: MobF family relaxase [Hyphomicrobiales bacterium]